MAISNEKYQYYLNKRVFIRAKLSDYEKELSYSGDVIDIDDETLILNDKFGLRQIISFDNIVHIAETKAKW